MEPKDSWTKIRISVQNFNIKEPDPTYDRLKAGFQLKYDIEAYNELIASLNYAIGTYTNNAENYNNWNPDYVTKGKLNIFLLIFGCFLFFISEMGISIGFSAQKPIIWQLSMVGFIFSLICACSYCVLWLHLRNIKKDYVESIRPLIDNALNLLNVKYENYCIYTIDKLYGMSQFDLRTSLQIRIKVKIKNGQRVNYIPHQQQPVNDGVPHFTQQQQQVVVIKQIPDNTIKYEGRSDDITMQ